MAKCKNTKLLFWCCKPLGLRFLHHLLDLKKKKYPQIELVGIGVSSKDPSKDSIAQLAVLGWPSCEVYTDSFELPQTVDLGLCVGFPKKISGHTLALAKNGVVNLHFAPLPKYRGSGTLEQAILNKESRYGVTLHFMDADLDTGPVIDRAWVPLALDATYRGMVPVLEEAAFNLLQTWIDRLLTTTVFSTPQSDLVARENVDPIFCTRASIKRRYKLSTRFSFKKLDRYVRALDKGSGKRPYFEVHGKRIYLTLDP